MVFYLLALLIGVIAGLRAMTAPAGTPLGWLGASLTPWIFTALALLEHAVAVGGAAPIVTARS